MELRSRKDQDPPQGTPQAPVLSTTLPSPSDRGLSRLTAEIRLGTAWVLTTIIGGLAIYASSRYELSRDATIVIMLGVLGLYALYGHSVRRKNTVKFAD